MAFNWDGISVYKASKSFPPGYPDGFRSFYSPGDDIHGLLCALLSGAEKSIVLNMFGYDDDEVDGIIRLKASVPNVYVQMSLDKTQAGGKHEKQILSEWHNNTPGTSVAIGTSRLHAISHLKVLIVDGIWSVTGSTNWSLNAEQKQDNELTISNSPVRAAELRSILDINHDFMLKQMANVST